jgi:hypothetical protein
MASSIEEITKEIRARVNAVDDGRAVGIPYEQIKKEIADRFY